MKTGKVRTRFQTTRLIVFILLCIIAISTLYPLFFMMLNVFKEKTEFDTNHFGLPNHLYLGNFVSLAENYNILGSLFNTIFVVVVSVACSILLASLAAFSFAKTTFRFQKFFFVIIISFMLIPGQVLLIPIYLMFSKLALVNNFLSIILVYTVTTLPYGIYLLTNNFRAIPMSLIESAKVDGASFWKIYRGVILPIGRTSIMTLAILNFLSIWNELLLSMMLLNDESKRLLTTTVATIAGKFTTNMPLMMTGMFLSSLPTIVVYLIFSKFLVKGITVGAYK